MTLFEDFLLSLTVDLCRRQVETPPLGYNNPKGFWDEADENIAFYNGNHFMGGKGWIGPGPAFGESGHSDFAAKLKPSFVSKNAIKKGVDRGVGGVVGKEPAFGAKLRRNNTDKIKPTTSEEQLRGEFDIHLADYFKSHEIHNVINDFMIQLALVGRAHLRVFIPEDELNENDEVPIKKYKESLNRLWVEVPAPKQTRVFRHKASMRRVGAFLTTREKRNRRNAITTENVAEVCWVDQEGLTHLAVVGRESEKKRFAKNYPDEELDEFMLPNESDPIDLKGNLWIYEAEAPPLITEQIRSLQKLLNLARTVERRNLADSGWLEEFLLNAQLPGKWVTKTFEDGSTERYHVPDPIKRGPNQIRNVVGVEYEVKPGMEGGEDGQKGLATPSVYHRQPVSPDNAIKVAEDCEQAIKDEMSQLHAALNDQAAPSGESRKQARSDFEAALDFLMRYSNAALTWIFETVHAAAVAHSGGTDPFEEFYIGVACRKNAGPRTGDERREDREQADAGYLSREAVLERDGVDDIDGETNRIEAQPGAMIEQDLKRAELFEVYSRILDVVDAAELAGFDEEKMAKIRRAAGVGQEKAKETVNV